MAEVGRFPQRAAPGFGLSRRLSLVVSLVAAGLILVILPELYAQVVLWAHGEAMTPALSLHILANCCANAVVALGCWGLKGRLFQKFAGVLNHVGLVHGLLAVVIVLTHSFYSNWVLVTAVAGSIALGLMIVLSTQLRDGPRIAVVAAPDHFVGRLGRRAERITDPATDLREYDVILIPSADAVPAEWSSAISRAMIRGRPVRHVAEYLEESRGVVSLEHFDLDDVPRSGLTSYRAGKRALDIAAVIVLSPIALVLLAGAVIGILATMGGPVFFVQERVGLGGRTFRMFKLRTMFPEAAGAGLATSKDDDRVTPLGRWLRRTRIDELPQLWHVLTGEMSLVGPRPEWKRLADAYVAETPTYAFRHIVRPGLTGWAQVNSGYAGNMAEMQLKVGYDLYYLKHFSLALDLQIVFRTLWILATGYGAR